MQRRRNRGRNLYFAVMGCKLLALLLVLAIGTCAAEGGSVGKGEDELLAANHTNGRSFTYHQSSGHLVGPGIDVVGVRILVVFFLPRSPCHALTLISSAASEVLGLDLRPLQVCTDSRLSCGRHLT